MRHGFFRGLGGLHRIEPDAESEAFRKLEDLFLFTRVEQEQPALSRIGCDVHADRAKLRVVPVRFVEGASLRVEPGDVAIAVEAGFTAKDFALPANGARAASEVEEVARRAGLGNGSERERGLVEREAVAVVVSVLRVRELVAAEPHGHAAAE